MAHSKEPYSILATVNGFKNCLESDGETIDLLKFVEAYKEFAKFLDSLGKVFAFVKADIVDKFKNIDKLTKNDTQNNYKSVQSTVDYERSKNIYMVNSNGTLSVLRLMRGLHFLLTMIENLIANQHNDKKTPELCSQAYEGTLAFRHKWAVRKLVNAGFYILPYKADLIDSIASGIPPDQDKAKFLSDYFATLKNVYHIIYKHYQKYDFLELVLA